MRLGVDVLFRHLDVGDLLGRHHQAEVYALEQEDGAVLQAAGDRRLADERPLTGQPAVAAVLQGRPRGQVALQERLEGRGGGQHTDTSILSIFKSYFLRNKCANELR